ncbi:alpha/beta fold hydrolase [Kribbella deserti]|uniref:Alpha/beta fold hydrolase n=1 Tax=Kribbella deserti TaxID=1926257 RepID=A0ABV6QIQ9_9ACTN
MVRSRAVDGFELAYDRTGIGTGRPVILLHGWPGDRTDYRALVPLLSGRDVIVPDLRGFGESDKHEADPAEQYNAIAQARSIIGLIEELELERPVLVGYDVGSRVAQAVAKARPELVEALVIAPPVPGVGKRVLGVGPQREFWYQPFHRLELAEQLIDGKPGAVRAYLRHFWQHWSGPDYVLDEVDLDHLVEVYGVPGAFVASINWYRAGAATVAVAAVEQAPAREDRVGVPVTVLWPEFDPLFPREWSDRLEDFFADARLELVDGVGHFAPVEYPERLAAAILGYP